MKEKTNFTIGVLTISDKGSRGEREDTAFLEIKKICEEKLGSIDSYEIIPDEKDLIKSKIVEYSDNKKLNLIITCGGTGFAKRDVTPEATLEVIEKQAMGLVYLMHMESLKITPHAALSRAVCGLRKDSLIVNLPGSRKAAKENLEFIVDVIPHGIKLNLGKDAECGNH